VVARFDATDDGFTLVSEELGVRKGGDTWVVLDPIDGSINAKRGLPFFSISVAVAEGGTMDDVVFGYVYDFGSGDEWVAERGGGARLNDAPLAGDPPKDRIELLALEATRTDLVARHTPPLVGLVHRLRILGSLALSLCHLADGRVDAVCSLKGARSVDIAAAQLLVRERGYAIELFEEPPFGAAPLDLEGRSRVVAAGTDELCAQIAAALST
jgi:myo-inositol-1(or 4)-monophosphatase